MQDPLKNIVSLCKRRGFIYPGSEIYGGFANTYSYGPYGAELKKNIKDLWWKFFVQFKNDVVGIDGPILLHPLAWKASGHVDSFNDALTDCRQCKSRFRVDQLIEAQLNKDIEGISLSEMTEILKDDKVKCPKCGQKDFTEARHFNLMFQTEMSKTDKGHNIAYLRPETAQAIFLEYKNIIDTMRVKIPFGIAQIGKAFRNEITPGNFVFRVIEFEQMEIEYFIEEKDWKASFESWLNEMKKWCDLIGLNKNKLHDKEHDKEKLSHYSKRTVDITYDFPFGTNELYGIAYRTDFDLKQHQEFSKTNLEYFDNVLNKRFIPHVIEPTFGVERTILALLCDAYTEELLENNETRTVLKFSKHIAPVKIAVFPLMKKEDLKKMSLDIFDQLKKLYKVEYDEAGAIGRRYRRQDELGTPYCITVDFDSLNDNSVTIRERDSMQQKRIKIDELESFFQKEFKI
ncbi:MAG: glycine--tRNA ligase [Chlamydiae bacterium RIFCSPHIGHO2_12_FULL_27_8]|nr:MAG: glycine--tRNA ligase [Chlamydiae bacterium RIFCSPHIGHO2_12_FULL_27_8]